MKAEQGERRIAHQHNGKGLSCGRRQSTRQRGGGWPRRCRRSALGQRLQCDHERARCLRTGRVIELAVRIRSKLFVRGEALVRIGGLGRLPWCDGARYRLMHRFRPPAT